MSGKQLARRGGQPRAGAGVGLAAASAVIVAWLAFLVWLLVKVDASEVVWARLLVVLGSVEAVAFAAAGALFGTSVQRQRAEEQRERADANEEAAINGQKLAAAVKATRAGGGPRENLSAGTDPLLELANRLFLTRRHCGRGRTSGARRGGGRYGFVLTADGLAATAEHVVGSCREANWTFEPLAAPGLSLLE